MDSTATPAASRQQFAKQLSGHHLVIRLEEDRMSFFVYDSCSCLKKTYLASDMPEWFVLYETLDFLYEFLSEEDPSVFRVDGTDLCFVDMIACRRREFRIPLDQTVMDREKSAKIELKRISYRLKLLLETQKQKEQELLQINRMISIKTAENEAIKAKLQSLKAAFNELLQVAEEKLSADMKGDNYLREQVYIKESLKKKLKDLERPARKE